MSTLKPYDAESKCPACDYDSCSRAFRPVTNDSTGKDQSYIKRCCLGCGYTWRELPLYKVQDRLGPVDIPAREGFSREEVLDIVTRVLNTMRPRLLG